MSAFGSATLMSPRAANDAKTPPVVGSDRTLMNGTPAARSRSRAATVFASCIRASVPSCIRAPPDAETTMSGSRWSRAYSAARVTFSPTTAPIDPPMNPKSITQIATGRPSIEPVPQTAASLHAGRELGGRDPVRVGLLVDEPERVDRLEAGVALDERAVVERGARAGRRPTGGSGGRTTGRPAWTLSSCLLNSISSQEGHFVQRSGG